MQKIIAIFLFLLAWIPPWVSIMPAYAHPDVLTAVPPTAQYHAPITFTWEDEIIQLVGVDIDPGQSITTQGEPVKLTLYWQAVTDIKNNYLSTIHLLGRNWESAGSVNRYPGWGMIPTNQWQAGQIWQDDYRVYAHEAAEAPTRLRIKVSLYNTAADTDLPTTINENPLDLVLVGEARLLATTPVQTNISTPMEISFADGIKLNGYTLNQETIESGKPITLELYWQVVGAPTTDYTVFVHLRDLEGNQLAGADAPPLNDDYPTSMWQPEDIIIDPHILFIPELVTPGTYKIAIGLYDPVTGVRVPLQDGGDEVQWQIKVD
ncbi:MAG: hypothetical protein GY943_05610 [Chloroflexi bacterium]|nr:hypothetical protein [Chloroflexota bacterium]